MIDFGEDVGQRVLIMDSSSAKSYMERRGAGRSRHLHCSVLWLQERVDSVGIRTEKERAQHHRQWEIHRALQTMAEISPEYDGNSFDQGVKKSGMQLSSASRTENGIVLQNS